MDTLYAPEIEKHCVAALLRHPEIFPDIADIVVESDFQTDIHRSLFSVIKGFLAQGEEANTVLIAQRIRGLGIRFKQLGPDDVFDYLESLRSVSQINANVGMESFRELKTVTGRREIAETCQNIIKYLRGANNISLQDIVDFSDKAYAGKISMFSKSGGDFANIYDEMDRYLEEGDPIDEYGMMGPFKRVNEMYGSLVMPGNITLIGARTGVGKTSLGFYYLTQIQEQYGVPLLHLDMGEMSREELMARAACMFTEGKVPLYYIQNRRWKKIPEYAPLVRQVMPRVRNLKTYYENVGGKSPQEILSIVRRFYLSKVGRGNNFLIHYDYLKPFEDNGNAQEYQAMGHFINNIKTLITTEVPVALWTSLQLNRSGITNGKRSSQVDDSENSFSVSDRIIQQVSHAFLVRPKLMDEMLMEQGLGNTKMIKMKARHLGEYYLDALNPVKVNGEYKDNYIHIDSKNFTFKEIGDLKNTAHKICIPTPDGDGYMDPVDLD